MEKATGVARVGIFGPNAKTEIHVKHNRILITGGAGFIGFHLAYSLALSGTNRVFLIDKVKPPGDDSDFGGLLKRGNVEFLQGDLMNSDTLESISDNFDQVYHLAALLGVQKVISNPYEVLKVNISTTLNVLEWFVRGSAKKLLFASTSEAYAWTQKFHQLPVPTPEDVPLSVHDIRNARSTYAASKIFGEQAVWHACRGAKRPFVIVRYHNVYGPRMGYSHVIPEIFLRIRRGEDPLTVYSPEHRRTFCHVKDAVKATVAAMERPEADDQVLNIGSDREEIKIVDLARKLLAHEKSNVGIRAENATDDPIVRRCPDLSLAKKLLAVDPSIGLDQGLEDTLRWYRDDFCKNLSAG